MFQIDRKIITRCHNRKQVLQYIIILFLFINDQSRTRQTSPFKDQTQTEFSNKLLCAWFKKDSVLVHLFRSSCTQFKNVIKTLLHSFNATMDCWIFIRLLGWFIQKHLFFIIQLEQVRIYKNISIFACHCIFQFVPYGILIWLESIQFNSDVISNKRVWVYLSESKSCLSFPALISFYDLSCLSMKDDTSILFWRGKRFAH